MFFRKPSDHVPHVTIFHTILRSMLWILFIEIALLVGILYLCRINTSLEQNAVDILQIQTENRQNYLQGQMLDAQDLSSLAGKINAVTQAMLDDGEISPSTRLTAAATPHPHPNSPPRSAILILCFRAHPAQIVQSLYIATGTRAGRPLDQLWGQRQQWLSIPSFRQPITETANWTPRTTATGRPLALHSPATITFRHRLHIPLILDDGTVYGVLGVENF